MGLVRAEIRKLTLGLVGTIAVCLVVTAIALAAMQQRWAADEVRIISGLPVSEQEIPCPGGTEEGSRECTEDRHMQYLSDRAFAADMRAEVSVVRAQRTVPGALGFTAGLMVTTPGLVVAFLLAAGLVAGEWQRGTARILFLAERRLWRILLAKSMVNAGVLCGVLVLAALGVYLFGVSAGKSGFPLGTVSVGSSAQVGTALRRCGLAVAILAAFALGATLAGAIMRRRVGTILAGAACLVVFNIASAIGLLHDISPFGVIVDAVGLHRSDYVPEYLMATPPIGLVHPGAAPPVAPAILPRLTWVLVCYGGMVLACWYWLRGKDLAEE